MKHWLIFTGLFLMSTHLLAQSRVVDSLSTLLAAAKTDAAKAPFVADLALHYVFNRADSALFFAQWGLRLSTRPESGLNPYPFYNVMGLIENNRGNYGQAIAYHRRAIEQAQQHNNELDLARSYNNLATVYSNQGNNHRSLQYYLESQKIYEKHNHPNQHALTLNIGLIYQFLQQYEKAKIQLFKALAGNRHQKAKRGEAMSLYNIGYYHQENLSTDSALWYYQQAGAMFKDMGQQQTLARLYKNSGKLLALKGKYEQAQQTLDQGFALTLVTQDRKTRSQLLTEMASLQMKQGHWAKADELAKQALELAKEINSPKEIEEAALILTTVSETKKDFGSALKFYRIAQAAKDSVENVERQKLIFALQGDYEIQTQQAKINLLNKDKELQAVQADRREQMIALLEQDAEIKQGEIAYQGFLLVKEKEHQRLDSLGHKRDLDNQLAIAKLQRTEYSLQKAQLQRSQAEVVQKNYQRNTLIGGVASLLILLVGLVAAIRQKQQANLMLNRQKEELAKLNTTKDKLFSIVAHDLRSPFQGLKWTMELLEQQDISQADFLQLTKQLKGNVETLSDNLNNLLIWATSQMKGIRPQPGQLLISAETGAVLELYAGPAAGKKLQLSTQVPDDVRVWADRDHLRLVLRNLVNNAIKFSTVGGQVSVSCEVLAKSVRVSVADTGMGIAPQETKNLFQPGNKISKTGTADEKGVGLGLMLCQEFLQANGGHIWVESELGQGSVFTFELPIEQN